MMAVVGLIHTTTHEHKVLVLGWRHDAMVMSSSAVSAFEAVSPTDEMNVRAVNLKQGPYDGLRSVASHQTAIHQGVVYVWDGSEDLDSFIHAQTAIEQLSPEQRAAERKEVEDWMESVSFDPSTTSIPAWRFNAWLQLIKVDAI